MKEFIGQSEAEVTSVTSFYSIVVNKWLNSPPFLFFSFLDHFIKCYIHYIQGKNADALALYFGEDPARCPFEQGNFGDVCFILNGLNKERTYMSMSVSFLLNTERERDQ